MEFSPQQLRFALESRAHVWASPAVIAVVVLISVTSPGPTEESALSWPACPWPLNPQQFTLPLASRAQLCEPPAAISVTPLARPATAVGLFRYPAGPPSWPWLLFPQHSAPPEAFTRQTCPEPNETSNTPIAGLAEAGPLPEKSPNSVISVTTRATERDPLLVQMPISLAMLSPPQGIGVSEDETTEGASSHRATNRP